MKINEYSLLLIVLSVLIFTLTSCSDDSSSGLDAADCSSLSLPTDLAPAQVSISYFNNQSVPNDDEHENYQMVKAAAQTGSSLLLSGGSFNVISTYVTTLQFLGVRAEASGGNCVWEFDPTQFDPEANDVTVTVIASQSGNRTNWEVNLSGDVGDENVDNFTFLDGFILNDGSGGEWRGFDPDNPGSAAYVYTWSLESEQVFQLNLDIESGDGEFVNYERDGQESNNLSISTGDDVVSVFWNESNDSGWIEEGNTPRRCYAEFVNAPC
jgi:hypothetical protein